MATLLLVVIYISYIGLGVPDSLFGTAWPAVYTEFGLPISAANAVTLLTSTGTIISSFASGRLVKRFGTGIVAAVSTALTALALFGFSISGNIYFLCLFAIPLGIGAGAIDVAQNSYVSLHYNARQMNFLHCFYGVGVAVSPYLMSLGLRGGDWRTGYLLAFGVQSVIAIIVILALPLWKRAHPPIQGLEEERKEKTLSLFAQMKRPAIRMTWLLFITSCSIEAVCTTWGSTFLVEVKGVSAEVAAKAVILYFLGLTLGRITAGLFANKLSPWSLMYIGCGVLAGAIILLALPISGLVLPCIGLFLTGFGVAPIFPNLTHLTPINFGKEQSSAVIGSQQGMAYVGIMFTPMLFGFLAQAISLHIFAYALGIIFVALLLAMLRLVYLLKKQGVYGKKL